MTKKVEVKERALKSLSKSAEILLSLSLDILRLQEDISQGRNNDDIVYARISDITGLLNRAKYKALSTGKKFNHSK